MRQNMPRRSNAPQFPIGNQGPIPNSPLATRSISSSSEGGAQQGNGGANPIEAVQGLFGTKTMVDKVMGGSAPAAATYPNPYASPAEVMNMGGYINPAYMGQAIEAPSSIAMQSAPAAAYNIPAAGQIGALGAGEMGAGVAAPMSFGAEAMPMAAEGASVYAPMSFGSEAALAGAGAEAAPAMTAAIPAGEAAAGGLAAEGALGAGASEAGLLGLGPWGWAALAGVGLLGVGTANDWW